MLVNGNKLTLNGLKLYKDYVKNDKYYWKCRKKDCNARAVTLVNGNKHKLVKNSDHNHMENDKNRIKGNSKSIFTTDPMISNKIESVIGPKIESQIEARKQLWKSLFGDRSFDDVFGGVRENSDDIIASD